jgi:hypothetical protein
MVIKVLSSRSDAGWLRRRRDDVDEDDNDPQQMITARNIIFTNRFEKVKLCG